jgi:hypothetical protein
MRVLLDGCMPRQPRRDLEGFDVKTVQEMGWTGVKNGAPLTLAGDGFDAVFTVDRGMEEVHTHLRARVALVIRAANTTDPLKRRPLMPRVHAAIQGRAPGRVVRVAP